MTKEKTYDWSGFTSTKVGNDNFIEKRYFKQCVSTLIEKYQMDESLAKEEIQNAYADYIKYYKVYNESETNLLIHELSEAHAFIRELEAGNLMNPKIILHATNKDGGSEKVSLQATYFMSSLISLLKKSPNPKRPSKTLGRPRGPEAETLALSTIAIMLFDRYKISVPGINDRYFLIGAIIIGINVSDSYTENYLDQRDKLIGKIKSLLRA